MKQSERDISMMDSMVDDVSTYRYKGRLSIEERTILNYIAAKILSGDYQQVLQLIKKQISKMHQSSKVF